MGWDSPSDGIIGINIAYYISNANGIYLSELNTGLWCNGKAGWKKNHCPL